MRKPSADYLGHSRAQNLKKLSIFALMMSFFCFLLWVDNEVPIWPLKLEYTIDYYNISGFYFIFYFLSWAFLHLSKKVKKSSIKISAIGFYIICSFSFMNAISYLEIARGSGLTALTLGYLATAILVSSRQILLSSIFILNSIFFYSMASGIEGIDISNYKMTIVIITVLSITAFIIFERQRRKVFNSQIELNNKIKELNKALDVKSAFYGHIIHELRTPLNAIIGFSEMINTDSYKPKTIEKIKEYTGFVQSSGIHLLSIVNELLDSTKVEAGEINVNLEKINLHQTLKTLINEISSIIIAKKQKISLEMDDENIVINMDKRILKQIIFNLLSNAQKFTKIGGTIEVIVSGHNNQTINIIIKDNGMGMDETMLISVNDMSTSSESYYLTSRDGTGFGLIIVRQLVKLLNGSINFKSEVGTGTDIKMTFPV